MKSIPRNQTHFHFIGIGGIGMSALALILAKKGYSISGSDKNKNESIANLISLGVKIFENQRASNITSICKNTQEKPCIVISTAIPTSNEELKAAQKANLDILHRSEVLGEVINQHEKSILVGGSHGKTTTSTIIATLLKFTNQDPTAVIGGFVPCFQSNGSSGKKCKIKITE